MRRVETGALRFGDDWPGVFLRADDAFYYGLMARLAMAAFMDDTIDGALMRAALRGLADLLQSCDMREESGRAARVVTLAPTAPQGDTQP